MSDNTQPPSRSSPTLPRGLVSRRGGIVNPSARMPSLRSPRDLTLGGRPKKSFKPNIPVRKERTREEPSDNSSASTSSSAAKEKEGKSSRNGANRGGRGRGRGRGGRRQLETIQTHSIFEQGPMERSNRGRGSSAPSYGGSGGSSFSSRQSGGDSKRISIKDENPDMLADLLRDDFIDLSTLSSDERYNPVQLPLIASVPKKEMKEKKEEEKEESKMEVEEEKESKMDIDVKVKSEPPDTDVEMKEFVKPAPVPEKLKPPTKSKAKTSEKVTCASLFTSDSFDPEGELVFFQLPDTLPSFPSGSEEEDRKPVIKQEKDVAGTSLQQQQQKENQESTSKNSCLKDLPEGYLGKLQVMKSGKTKLVLGNIKLDVSMGSPCGFLQDLVSVKLGGDKGGELVTLGHINHRVVCTPDFEQLLQLGL